MPEKRIGKTPADCLRKIADHLDNGDPESEWGPWLVLMGRAMMKRAKPSK